MRAGMAVFRIGDDNVGGVDGDAAQLILAQQGGDDTGRQTFAHADNFVECRRNGSVEGMAGEVLADAEQTLEAVAKPFVNATEDSFTAMAKAWCMAS